jgi:Hypothetical methyltransferase
VQGGQSKTVAKKRTARARRIEELAGDVIMLTSAERSAVQPAVQSSTAACPSAVAGRSASVAVGTAAPKCKPRRRASAAAVAGGSGADAPHAQTGLLQTASKQRAAEQQASQQQQPQQNARRDAEAVTLQVEHKRKKKCTNKFKQDSNNGRPQTAPAAVPDSASTAQHDVPEQQAAKRRKSTVCAQPHRTEAQPADGNFSHHGAAHETAAGTTARQKGFLGKMRKQLHGGRFRMLNERLYTTSGETALQEMQVCLLPQCSCIVTAVAPQRQLHDDTSRRCVCSLGPYLHCSAYT